MDEIAKLSALERRGIAFAPAEPTPLVFRA